MTKASIHVLVLTPAGSAAPELAIAACRAGECGLLDLEFLPEYNSALAAVEQLKLHTRTGFGLKLSQSARPVWTELPGRAGDRWRWAILAGAAHSERAEWIETLRQRGVTVLIEAVSLAEAQAAMELRPDGLILKGQEAGGRVGEDTSFILLQRFLAWSQSQNLNLPVYVQGGIGLNTMAACQIAGAAGVVLDAQLLLARESSLSEGLRQRLVGCDGSETVLLGEKLGAAYRVFGRTAGAMVDELRKLEDGVADGAEDAESKRDKWRQAIQQRIAGPEKAIWLVGQDIAFAAGLALRAGVGEPGETVSAILQTFKAHAEQHLRLAGEQKALGENSPFARAHKMRYPIFQGPMTRVSDTAAFAGAVAEAGGLPFLALALLRQAETEKLLEETRARLGDLTWGVGILGFVPADIRQEQMLAIRTFKPPFALIAGGRPDQARELENQGIPTYLHVPSPGLLRMFLKDGARRFIFEGRECGGHVGPRTSFVLWESMIEVLNEHIAARKRGDDLFVVFAGGIHDALSSAMVASMAAGLVRQGVRIGVLMGTAYLFTREAVEGGAIVPRFQQEAMRCSDTVLLESGPGHAIRCIPSPYADLFNAEKRRLQQEGKSVEEIRKSLEWMNLGRLRVASKGLDRVTQDNGAARLASLPDDDQFLRGMYMIGQVAGLRRVIVPMADLHADVCIEGARLLEGGATTEHEDLPPMIPAEMSAQTAARPCDVAVVGMSCFYPRSGSVKSYWDNILAKIDAVAEVPASHWDWRLYYDPDPRAKDKSYSKWGGFLEDVLFDPLVFGMPPNTLTSIEPLQLMLLEGVRQALAHAGYAERSFDREHTCAIVGVGGGGAPLSVSYGLRSCMPLMDTAPGMPVRAGAMMKCLDPLLPEWTEDSFPGILLNVASGRVANRFNFGGANFALDAACASSLAALHLGVRELQMGTSNVAVVMGADTVQTPFAYIAFSKTHALSALGKCRPFDAAADGIVLSEGVGVVILKRLADAERDGDRIHAVIKGVGASSDGRDKGLTAPRAEGQLRALRRAYSAAGVSPSQVGLVEAHGTGTVVGDRTEAQALREMFIESGAGEATCALGSVKSLIGHSKCAAGIAGFIKTVLALHHKVLPPTQVEKPNARAGLDQGPLYLNTESRPWVQGNGQPRRAGVSAFGFGGTNFHVVLEEYTGDYINQKHSPLPTWPAELLVWRRPQRKTLIEDLQKAHQALKSGARPILADWAGSLVKALPADVNQPTLALVAASVDDAKEKIAQALKTLAEAPKSWADPRGVWFAENPGQDAGKVAVLFPGQGSQYVNMLAQTALAFPQVREVLDRADLALQGRLEWPLSRFIYPPSSFTTEQEQHARQELTRTEVAQPAIGAASVALWRLLHDVLGIEADFFAGHSYGEYVSLYAAGAMSEQELFRISHRRGAVIHQATAQMPGAMAAVEGRADMVAEAVKDVPRVSLANLNSPLQTVISGPEEGIVAALQILKDRGIRGQRLTVACGFHSPLVAPAQPLLAAALRQIPLTAPKTPVYSNITAQPYPAEPAQMQTLLATHLTSPVRFQEQIESLHQAGARIFLEVGPHSVLTGLVGQILKDRPHLAAAADARGKPGLVQLQTMLAQALVHGLPVQLHRLHEHRGLRAFDLAQLDQQTGQPKVTPTTWMVNSVRSKPINAPEPRLIGQTRPAATEQATSRNAAMSKPVSVPPAVSERLAATSCVPAVPGVAPLPAPVAPAPALAVANMPAPSRLPAPEAVSQPAPAAMGGPGDEAAQVMMRFQDLMARFLDTQKSVMLTYLQGGPINLPAMSPLPRAPQELPPTASTSGSNGTRHGNGHNNGHGNGHPPARPKPAASAPATPAPAAAPVAAKPAPVAEPAPAPVALAPTVTAAKPALDADALLARLLDLVSQRTGYPKEMLDLDLDLEADLGIDSIKRVEILGTLAESIEGLDMTSNTLEMEKLTTIRTLRGIIAFLDRTLNQAGAAVPTPAPAAAVSQAGKPAAVREGDVMRLTVSLVDAPLSEQPLLLNYSGPLLLTDDGRGIARAMAARLNELGQSAVLLRMTQEHGNGSAAEGFSCDLTDADAVAHALDRIRNEVGCVAGLIHLLPLGEALPGESPEDRSRREVKSLYLLARALEEGLRRQGKETNAVLLTATQLGGRLGVGEEPLPAEFFSGQGGVLGFTKCVAHEWPEVLVRAVDLDGSRPTAELSEQLLAELGDPEGPLEVGHAGSRRVTTLTLPAPLENRGKRIEINAQSTILVTGGARGITAEVALELARRFRPNLVLVGRSPLPAEEPDDTAVLSSQADVKQALMAHLQRQGQTFTPAQIEAMYQRLMTDREIRGNLNKIRQTGAQAAYRAVDVREEEAVVALLRDVEKQFGKIDGVIHGAGVIEDRLLKDKTPESFERVFSTKVDSSYILARHLKPDALKFWMLFSSIAGRYGNRGQSDYAAANEVLAKLAVEYNRRWPGRVVSLAWGPWSGTGMVANLEKHLVQRGLKLIAPEVGSRFVIEELLLGGKEEAEVVVAGGSEQMARPARSGEPTRVIETVGS
jgi:acyl transferase domain-containing protein/NAD(P)H-dependent flavin oxidoreductase YrpB (nitropropane dioxygenase family)/NAD(P)-dependent dehydrogenase (short-subunit alcohol dehydrogenase family)